MQKKKAKRIGGLHFHVWGIWLKPPANFKSQLEIVMDMQIKKLATFFFFFQSLGSECQTGQM